MRQTSPRCRVVTDPLRVLVVDDEPLARQRVVDLLDQEPDVEWIGTAGTGRAAVGALRDERGVDLVFLDVQMPGLSGLDVVRDVGPGRMPVTVFVTAYDQHALAAFEAEAVDYLLKPFDDDRFRQSLDRARRAIRFRSADALRGRLESLLGASNPHSPETPTYRERFAVEARGQTRIVRAADVAFITSDGPYAQLHADGTVFVIRETMRALEETLDPAHFARIHRSTIVRLDRVEALLTAPGGDYSVRLTDGTRLSLSRSRRDVLLNQLGIGPDG